MGHLLQPQAEAANAVGNEGAQVTSGRELLEVLG